MKKILQNSLKMVFLSLLVQGISSCAYLMNSKEVEVAIESSPPGADIIIEGRNYGKTPKRIKIIPQNHTAILTKEGYGSASIELETWQAVREDKAEGGRCLADALGSMFIVPAFSYWSVYCRDFKEKKYSVTIPYTGGPQGSYSQYNSPYSAKRNNAYGTSRQGYGYYNQGMGARQDHITARRRYGSGNRVEVDRGDIVIGTDHEYYNDREYSDSSFGNPGVGF